ncbi:MAG: hypothetical protein Hals2KO_21260 [Halioglobus sp.]
MGAVDRSTSKRRSTLRNHDILRLPRLLNGEQMSQQEITDAVNRRWQDVREDLVWLVMGEQLGRICGIGSKPAMYYLPKHRSAA